MFKHVMSCLQIQSGKHLVTASYVDDSMSKLDESAKSSDVTILCEMGLDPGIGNLLIFDNIDVIEHKRYADNGN